MNPKLHKWERWLNAIRGELTEIMRSRLVFREIFDLIQSNPELPSSSLVYFHLRAWYGDHAIMALRRQLKDGQQSISFLGLLQDIHENTTLVPDHQGRVLSAQDVHADIQRLREAAESCEPFADKRIAHYDQGQAPKSPSYDELDAALDALDELFCKYLLLVTGEQLTSSTPSIAYNWCKVFQHAWMAK